VYLGFAVGLPIMPFLPLEGVTPGDKDCPTRRYLQEQWHHRRFAPSGTCHALGGLEAYFAWRLKSSAMR